MADSTLEPFVRQIHATPTLFVLALSGGGSDTLAQLLGVPGASRTILEAIIPYSQKALCRWLGGTPDQFCSPRTARAMAMSGFLRACQYEDPERAPLAGIGVTASLATDRPKRGPHRIHLALQTADQTLVQSVRLVKDRRRRAEEEAIASALMLNLMAEACGIGDRLPLELPEDEPCERRATTAPPPWRDLMLSKTRAVSLGGTGGEPALPAAVFSGAFNPIHAGHRRMAEVASGILGCDLDYELSILNVDKPPLDYLEIGKRVSQFEPATRVWLTRAPTFEQKARQFPGATFVVGIDTLRRIALPEYYGGSSAAAERAIDEIVDCGCRFLVFGRSVGSSFIRLGDLELPAALAGICREVPEARFREDISSTEIRRRQRDGYENDLC